MTEVFVTTLNIIYVFLVFASIYGAFKGNLGLVIFSYLVVSFKTNLLTETGVADTYFEPQYIIAIIWFVGVLINWSKLNKSKMGYADKSVLILVIVLFIAQTLETVKAINMFNSETEYSVKSFIKQILEILVLWTSILILPKLQYFEKYLKNGILWGVAIIAMQSFFASDIDGTKYSMDLPELENRVGGFMKMDLNELTALMTIPAYFILILVLNKRINRLVGIAVLIAIFISVLFTGSRTGLFAALLSPLFLIFSPDETNRIKFNFKRFKYVFFSIILVVAGYFILQTYGETTLQRFSSEKLDENIRVQRYPEYIYFFSKNPDYLFTGAQHEITSSLSYKRAAHNFYIQRVYGFGILYLLFILFLFRRLIKFSNKFIRFPIYIYLFYGLTLSNPPLGYLPFIVVYFSHYISIKPLKHKTNVTS